MRRNIRARLTATTAICAIAVCVGGCAMDDIELNGGVFDTLGIGSNSAKKSSEPKLAARAPLVVPPGLERLPAPGQPTELAAIDQTASINDPDRVAKVSRAELERQQAEYCSKNYDLAKASGDNNADLAVGPLGPCRKSALGLLGWGNQPEPEAEE
jgi:hypothetical protein